MDASKVYDEAIVIDGLSISNWESDAVFQRLRAGNITAINATVATWENFQQTMAHLAKWMRRFRERQDILQVKETADIHTAKKLGKTGIILGFQNASPIENELDRLGLFLALGVRVIQLTYHETNLLGSGCWERFDSGLSNFGVDAVREMNRLGILIDLSHVGPKTTMEAIEMSEQPVAITHANARSFYNHPRNKEEDALKLLAEKGGVVGATSYTPFLPKGYDSTLEDFVDALDNMVERIGLDHVAIGTDSTHDQPLEFWHFIVSQQGTKFPSTFADGSVPYTEINFQPKGIDTPAEFPNLAEALAKAEALREGVEPLTDRCLPHVFAQHLGAGRGLALGVGKGDLAHVDVPVGIHRHRMGREKASRAVGVVLAPLGQDASVGCPDGHAGGGLVQPGLAPIHEDTADFGHAEVLLPILA